MSSEPDNVSNSWRAVSVNPVAPEVHHHLLRRLSAIRELPHGTWDEQLGSWCRDRTVLDIGCVEHDPSHYDAPGWRHGLLARHAARLVGVDILATEVATLRQRGFDIRCVDATSDADLGERFARVVLGDVIEHVDDPVRLLRFAARHLDAAGEITVTTPNPFFIGHILRAIREGTFIANAEHVSWITPTNAIELGHRAGLELIRYIPLWGPLTPDRLVFKLLQHIARRPPEMMAGAYAYVYARRP